MWSAIFHHSSSKLPLYHWRLDKPYELIQARKQCPWSVSNGKLTIMAEHWASSHLLQVEKLEALQPSNFLFSERAHD